MISIGSTIMFRLSLKKICCSSWSLLSSSWSDKVSFGSEEFNLSSLSSVVTSDNDYSKSLDKSTISLNMSPDIINSMFAGVTSSLRYTLTTFSWLSLTKWTNVIDPHFHSLFSSRTLSPLSLTCCSVEKFPVILVLGPYLFLLTGFVILRMLKSRPSVPRKRANSPTVNKSVSLIVSATSSTVSFSSNS